jgi:RNA polymerase sigma-70 factor (ECF subfamily)
MPPQPLAAQGPDPADEDLLSLVRRGDAAAFRSIIKGNNQRLFRLARGVLGDDAEAEDVVQETYLRAFTHLDQFKGSSSLSTWLARIAINEALGRRRRKRAMTGLAELSHAEHEDGRAGVIPFLLTHAEPSDPEHAVARAEIRRLLERAIDALPAAFRIVFVLREIEQMSVEETARCLGIPAETVKTRLHRAKAKLRRGLDEQLAAGLADIFPFAGARCDRLTAAILRRLGFRPR